MDLIRKDVGGKFTIGGKSFTIYGGVNPIGRNREAAVNIKSLGVSQQHAIIILVDDDLHFISDLKSSNGTFLNNIKLNPLHLYRLHNGSRIKFADIEGIYQKCTLRDIEHHANLTSISDNTQNFYGSDTQIIEKENTISKNTTPEKNYISSQLLSAMIDKLEESILESHEMITQPLYPTESSKNKDQNLISCNESNIDLHEAETQVIVTDQVSDDHQSITSTNIKPTESESNTGNYHEAETQVIEYQSEVETSLKSIIDLHEMDRINDSIDDYTMSTGDINQEDTDVEISLEKVDNVRESLHDQELAPNMRNPAVLPLGGDINPSNNQIIEGRNQKESASVVDALSQDNEIIKPLGLTRNVLNDSLDESDSEIIRPVKKSVTVFRSHNSTFEDTVKNTEKLNKVQSDKLFESQESTKTNQPEKSENDLDESESDIIRPTKKPWNLFQSQESEDGSNDSLDFMTMQKIPSTQKLVNSEDDSPTNQSSTVHQDDKALKIFSNESKITSFDEAQNTDSETDVEENVFNSKEAMKKKNLKKTTTINNSVSDSDTDDEQNKNNPLGKPVSVCSGSDTDIENNDIINDCEKNKSITNEEQDKNNPHPKSVSVCSGSDTDIEDNDDCKKNKINTSNNESFGLVLEESALEETFEKPGKSQAKKEIPIDQNNLPSRQSVGGTELLDDSDFIAATQEDHSKPISQNSKYESSENSFKLGLTQLMEDDDSSQKNEQIEPLEKVNGPVQKNSSQNNSQNSQKKFTFKKSTLGQSNLVDITLDFDDEIYAAKTQNLIEDTKMYKTVDDQGFVRPTQEAPKRQKQNKMDSIPDEEIYLLSTQKFDGSPVKASNDDFYQQSTQKLVIDESVDSEKTKPKRLSDNILYELPTQKIPEKEGSEHLDGSDHKNVDDDIFATQVMIENDSPIKSLENELECMFATQKMFPADDTLDRIHDIVQNKGITDDKLPSEDKDLEAILATQSMIDSPKRKKTEEILPEKTVESQLEVIFASQTCTLPPDKFVRPKNPLVNIFGDDTQNTEEFLKAENSSLDESKKASNYGESSFTKPKKTSQIGLEQSIALLEAQSTKIRRSRRNNDCDEITVSCPKSRVSMVVAPNDIIAEEETKPLKPIRTSRKRQPPAALENFVTAIKEPRRSKRRRCSESSNASDEDNEPDISSRSSKKNILSKIQEGEERPETPNMKRSSRMQKKFKEYNEESFEQENKSTTNTKSNAKTSKTNEINNYNSSSVEKVLIKNEANKSHAVAEVETANEKRKMDDGKKTSRSRSSRSTKNKNLNLDTTEESINRNASLINHKLLKNEKSSEEDEISVNNKGSSKIVNRISKIGKADVERPATPSRTSKRGSTIEVTTPTKLLKVSEATPSCSRRKTDLLDTPNRTKRKLKPKVVFTMMENPKIESQIKQLGGSVVDSVDACTVLLTTSVKRSMKLLSAVGLGRPICSEDWVLQSKKENNFLDPWDYILIDKEAEKKWDFSLKTSLERSSQAKLFEDYTFQLLVTNALDVLKGAIESCGGKIVTRTPKGTKNFVVVATTDQKDKYKKIIKQQSSIIVVEPEAIFDGVLRQEIRFERHLLN